MAKREIKAGSTDQTIDVFAMDATSGVGAGLTGLVYNSAGLACYYRKGATGSATQLTLATQTVGGAHSDGGFVEISSANMTGVYRLDLSDTMVSAAGMLTVMIYGATNLVPIVLEIEVVSVDKFDAVRGGMTALPNVVSGSSGAILTHGTGTAQLNVSGGKAPATLAAADVSGNLTADVQTIKTQTVTCSAGVTVGAYVGGTGAAALEATAQSILTDTAEIGVAGAGLTEAGGTGDQYTAIPWNAAWDAEVESECTDALNAYDPPTNAEMEARTLVAANYATAANLATVAGYIDTEIGTIITNLTDIKGATFDTATDSLEAIRNRGDSAWITATGFSTLDAAGVRSAVGLAAANLDSQLDALPTAAENATELLDTSDGIETSVTPRGAMRAILAMLAGVITTAGTTTEVFKNPSGGTTRVTVTVDEDGNRTVVVLNV